MQMANENYFKTLGLPEDANISDLEVSNARLKTKSVRNQGLYGSNPSMLDAENIKADTAARNLDTLAKRQAHLADLARMKANNGTPVTDQAANLKNQETAAHKNANSAMDDTLRQIYSAERKKYKDDRDPHRGIQSPGDIFMYFIDHMFFVIRSPDFDKAHPNRVYKGATPDPDFRNEIHVNINPSSRQEMDNLVNEFRDENKITVTPNPDGTQTLEFADKAAHKKFLDEIKKRNISDLNDVPVPATPRATL
jgi:chorismate mutase